MVHFPSENTQPGSAEGSSSFHTPGLWRNLGLSRLERVKAHRDEFGSSLKVAIEAVDEDFGRQAVTGRARLAEAAPDLLKQLQSVLACMEITGQSLGDMDAIRAAIRKATTPAADTQVGTSNASEPKTPANGDSQ